MRDGHIRPAYSFMWARGPSANRLLIFHMDRDRYWPALACGDDNNRSLPGHVSLHTTDYRGIADVLTNRSHTSGILSSHFSTNPANLRARNPPTEPDRPAPTSEDFD